MRVARNRTPRRRRTFRPSAPDISNRSLRWSPRAVPADGAWRAHAARPGRRVPVVVASKDSAGFPRDPGLDFFRHQRARPIVDVREHRARPDQTDGVRGFAEGIWRRDHLIARADPVGRERHDHSERAARNRDGILPAKICGERRFERFDQGPARDPGDTKAASTACSSAKVMSGSESEMSDGSASSAAACRASSMAWMTAGSLMQPHSVCPERSRLHALDRG